MLPLTSKWTELNILINQLPSLYKKLGLIMKITWLLGAPNLLMGILPYWPYIIIQWCTAGKMAFWPSVLTRVYNFTYIPLPLTRLEPVLNRAWLHDQSEIRNVNQSSQGHQSTSHHLQGKLIMHLLSVYFNLKFFPLINQHHKQIQTKYWSTRR